MTAALNSPRNHVGISGDGIRIWARTPPLYFLMEYGFEIGDKEALQHLEHGQELAAHVWAGVGALLAGIYSHRGMLSAVGHE